MVWFNAIKGYYTEGFYSNDDVKIFVQAAWITADQYKQITGVNYVPAT
ncbi:XkdX family protein [Cytobacillus kochii]